MNFREHKNVFVKCVTSRKPSDLEWVIEEAGRQYNLIDLQYSTALLAQDLQSIRNMLGEFEVVRVKQHWPSLRGMNIWVEKK